MKKNIYVCTCMDVCVFINFILFSRLFCEGVQSVVQSINSLQCTESNIYTAIHTHTHAHTPQQTLCNSFTDDNKWEMDVCFKCTTITTTNTIIIKNYEKYLSVVHCCRNLLASVRMYVYFINKNYNVGGIYVHQSLLDTFFFVVFVLVFFFLLAFANSNSPVVVKHVGWGACV